MRAAIYARKSTQQDVADEARSVTRQIEGARTFIRARGWTETLVYEDDAVSGALFATREQFQRMMRDARTGAFDVLVIFDLDRFGRHAQKSMEALHALADLDVEVYDYSTGQRIDLNTFEGEMSASFKAMLAQYQRAQVRKHTAQSQRQQFLNGYVAGGKIFGYDNLGPRGQKVRVINDAEADVVREIYRRYAAGEGYRRIAWSLNERGLPSPRAQQGRPRGWEPGTIRALLDNTMYRGVEYYGRSAKAYGREIPKDKRTRRRRGVIEPRERGQFMRPESAWLKRECPRIVDAELAARVDGRRGNRSERYRTNAGHVLDRPARHTRYLLSGLLVCPCGARFEAIKGSHGKRPGNIYMCAARRRKGPSVCRYDLAFPIEQADEMILDVIAGDVLSPEFIEELVASVDTGITSAERAALEVERTDLLTEIENLTTAIAQGGDIPQLVASLKERSATLRTLDSRLTPRETADREKLRAALEQRCADWREVLRSRNAEQGRAVLMQLVGPLEVEGSARPSWITHVRPEGLLGGLGTLGTSPTGFEPVFWP